MISGPMGALPQMPGFTPVLMNVPMFPQENGSFPLQMQPFNPIFLNPNQNNVLPFQHSQSASPVFLPMQPMQMPVPNFIPGPSPQFQPSLSPPQQMMPMLSLSPVNPPMVSVSTPPMSQSVPPTTSQSSAPSNYLSAALADRRSRSRSCSVASESDSGDLETRGRSFSREVSADGGPSKRALVDKTLGWMESVFGERYDNDGCRGENVLRLKVKTVVALEHIIEFISLCHKEGLIHSISCPVSTKKGRQHVRGYLAYIKGFSGTSADRIQAIFEAYNQEKGFPFKTLHRNPASTL